LAERGNLQAKLNAGIEAARAGDQETARRLLQQVLTADPNNEVAWMWMASVAKSVAERRACLERVLRINPNNTRAREALRRLEAVPEARTRDGVDLRETELRRARRIELQGGPRRSNPYFIMAGIVLVFVIIAAVLLFTQEAETPSTQPVDADSTDDAVVVVQPTRPIPTLTPIPGMIVTIDPNRLTPLPPTFTPTFTPTATDTPLPSPTPPPLASYRFYYAGAQPGQTAAMLYSVRGDSSDDSQLGNESGITDFAISPNGEQIAFVRPSRAGLAGEDTSATGEQIPEAGLPQLFVAPLANPEAATQLTQLRGNSLKSPRWSPDGARIAFASDDDGDLDIYVIASSGGEPVRLTANPGIDTDPAWSPDGTRIAYASDQNSPAIGDYAGSVEIFVMNDDGTNPVQLTDAENDSFSPVWSPDGQWIVFISNRSIDNDVYIMEANGEGEMLVTFDDDGADDRAPSFTSDGRWIAFLSNRDGDRYQIYLVDPQGVQVTRVTDNNLDIHALAVYPGAP